MCCTKHVMYLSALLTGGTFFTGVYYAILASTAEEGNQIGLACSEIRQDIGLLRMGEDGSAFFTLHNSSKTPVSILGADDGCREDYCVKIDRTLPMLVEAGQSQQIKVSARAIRQGSYSIPITLYLDSPGQATLALTIQFEVAQ